MRGLFRTGVNTAQPHDSARKHVAGAALYVDDIPEPPGMLHAALVLSPVAHGRLCGFDTSRALRAPGVVSVITAADIPGKNDIAPIAANEPLFAADVVQYAGQPVAAIAADTRDQALAAVKLVTVNHLLPSLTQKIEWPEAKRTVILTGTRGEVPILFQKGNEKKPMLDVVPRFLITGRRVAGSSFGGVKGRDQVPQLVDRWLAGEIDVEPFVSHKLRLDEVNRGFELMEAQDGIRSVIDFGS